MSETDYKLLSEVLNEDQMRQLPSFFKTKIESHLEGIKTTIDNMKTQLSNNAVNADKKSLAVDRELQNTKSKLQMNEDFAERLKNHLKETEEALQKSRHEYYEILQSKDSLTYELNSLKEKMNRFNDEKSDLTELLNRRQEEIQSLQNELKSICSQLKSNSNERIETTIRAKDLELKIISVEHQEIKMSHERELYQKQIQTLNEELNAKVNELMTLRRDRTIQVFELQSTLELKTYENTKYLEEIKHLKQMVDNKDKHIDSLSQKMCEIKHFSQQMEEDFQNEIKAQNNLIELHQQSNNDLKKRNESLIETIEEMQKILQTAKEAHNELETTFNESQNRFIEQLNESMEQNTILAQELKESVANASRANLEAQFEQQYPVAANTKRFLGKNMSFTQIFNELVAKQQELEEQKSENIVLKEHLQHLASEAEENAPLLHRKIQEYQRALENIGELQSQLSSIIMEREQWLKEKDTIIRINKQYEREINRFESENRDLSKQIRALIKSVQEARGFRVTGGQDSQISSSISLRGVPQELVTFRDIEELQIRNQELMNALRETNEKIRNSENEKNDRPMHSLRKDLDEALLQLESLRAERRKQTELVEAIVKQRDAYKMMASNTDPDSNQAQKSAPGMGSPFSSNVSNEEQNKSKSNLEDLRNEYEKHRENNKIKALTETNEKLMEELSNIKIETATLSAELAFTQERLQMFKANCEQFQRENALLRERNTILSESNKKHEQSLVLMRQELLSLNEKLNRYEMNIESIKSERDLYRNSEQNLLQEKELLIRNQENQNKLINTLQSVENHFNQLESDTIRSLKTQNIKLEKESAYLKNKSEKDSQRHSESTIMWEKHSQELKGRLDTEIEKYLRVQKEMTEYQTKARNLEHELNSIKTGVNQLIESGAPASTEADRVLQSQLIVIRKQYNEAQNEINQLTAEVKRLSDELNGLKTEQTSSQNTIIQLRKVARKYKMQFDELKVQFDKINESKSTAAAQVSAISEAQSAEHLQKVEELNSKIKELNEQIEKLNNDLIQVTEERETARAAALEKEEKAKKIAHHAKLRLATISGEKLGLLKEKESLQKSIEELTVKMKQTEQSSEEMALRMSLIKSQYEAKAIRYEKELSDANKLIESLKTKQQKATQPPMQSTSTAIGVSTVSVQTSQSPSNPVRHSVQPQPLSAKSTPMASIRPLAVAPALHRTGRNPNVSARTATVATVQPTTEESTSHQSVPQATVQPTQTVSSQMAFVPPTSSSESDVIITQNEEQIEDLPQTQQNNEIPEHLPQLGETYFEDNSQASNNEEMSSPPNITTGESSTEASEPSTSVKIDRKRTRHSSSEMTAPLSPKKLKIETEEVRPVEVPPPKESTSDTIPPRNIQNFEEDDDVIILLSDSEDEQRDEVNEPEYNEDEEEDEDENEDEEEEDEEYEVENEENVEEPEDNFCEDNDEYNEEEDDDESHYEDDQNEDNSDDNEEEDIEVVGVSEDMPESNANESEERLQSSETSATEPNDPIVSTTMSSIAVTSAVTSSTEPNPFMQIPTPIQRPGFGATGRQSFYLSHPQQTYDEGDGIVPSTPTLYVPRRGDGLTDPLNSPRVPQSRFVFSASIPESTPLSQLATETTLGVDDTRMDLSQFDDTNGRSVPTTPLANSPANNSLHSTVQNIEIIDNDSNQNFGIDPNETVIPDEFETDSGNIETENPDSSISANTSADNDVIEIGAGQMSQTMSETQFQEPNIDETEQKKDETQTQVESESIPTSTSSAPRGTQIARRGRIFSGASQSTTLQRRPILAPTSQVSPGVPPNRQPTPSNVRGRRLQLATRQPTAGRTIRLRGSRFSTQANFRGGPPGPGGRGSRGGYQN